MARTHRIPSNDETENFFEALGATANRYTYPDATKNEAQPDALRRDDAKLTAIITLVLVIFLAVVMAVLMLRGLEAVKSSLPSQSDASGSLEL